jgi:V8-like Glu-specific endopeptidase
MIERCSIKIAIIFCIAIVCPSHREASAQYLDPIGTSIKYGCGVADNAKQVFSVSKTGMRKKLTKKQVAKLIVANQNGSKTKRKFAADLKKCIRGKLPSTNACDVLDNKERGAMSALVVQGRLCTVDDSPIVPVSTYAGAQLIDECSGVMISHRVLLTAAHCMYTGPGGETTADRVTIRVGEAEYSASYVGFPDAARKAKPQYEFYDIGFAVFDEPIPGITPVGIVSRDAPIKSGERVVVAGYGKDETGLKGDLIAGFSSLDQVGEAFMTTHYKALPGESASCSGDSGGALLVNRNGSWVLAGIISYGPLSCGPAPVADPVNHYGHANFYYEPLYNLLSDSTCFEGTGCPLPIVNP